MSQDIDSCDGLLDAVEGGIDYRELQAVADGDGAVADLASVIFSGDAESLDH